ncbi:MAG: protein arginine kinase, partial [Planctomycetota bacterium]
MPKTFTAFDNLAKQPGEWLRGSGPESDIVISSRLRLARNLAHFPFIRKCDDKAKSDIERLVAGHGGDLDDRDGVRYVDVDSLSEIDRNLLVERQLISRSLADGEGARSVLIDPVEKFSVMVNEEDHLRIQVMRSGLDLSTAWDRASGLDDRLQRSLPLAFDPNLGFLTACPTNVGTGLRVSVMIHLPGLVITDQIEKVFRSLQQINVTVRGLYGEGSQYSGDFYQISNQVTLGRSEDELIHHVAEVTPLIIDYERKARQFLIDEQNDELQGQLRLALEMLRTADQISSELTMQCLSKLRMGVNLGLVQDVSIGTINRLFIQT